MAYFLYGANDDLVDDYSVNCTKGMVEIDIALSLVNGINDKDFSKNIDFRYKIEHV